MTAPTLAEVLPAADVIHDRATLDLAIQSMADAIRDEYAGDTRPPLFVTIMHGGMPFATQLAFALGEVVEVLQGLKVGQQVVVQGAGFLSDGDRVRVVDAPKANAAK